MDETNAKHGSVTIGFDAKRIVRNATGLGSYGRNLVNALAAMADGRAQLLLYAPDTGRDCLRGQVRLASGSRFVYPHGRMPKWLWRSHGIVKDLVRDGVSLYHGLSGELPCGIGKAGIRSVVTIHDLIFLRHPEYYNPLDVLAYTAKFRRTIREAQRIIAISQCTKRDIAHYGGIDPGRIDVIYQSCSPRFKEKAGGETRSCVRQAYALPRRYIIFVGSIEERKNILLAVKALKALPDDLSIVAVGRRTHYSDKVLRWAVDNGVRSRVLFLHGVPNAHLPALYQMAEACVYPSRYEGFGIPVIEAVQSGVPVVACKGSCLEEAGGPDGIYVSPDDPRAMAEAVRSVLRGATGRERRIAAMQSYVKRFESADAARRVGDVYGEMLGLPLTGAGGGID